MKNKKTAGHIAILITNIIFGLNTVISRTITPDIVSPFTLSFCRMTGAMILFWTVSLFTKKEKVSLKDIGLLALTSLFALVFNQIPFIMGLSKTSPVDASIILTILPIVSMLLAALFLKEPITVKKTAGVMIGAGGALLLILSQHKGGLGSGSTLGNLIIIGSVLSYSIYLTLFKPIVTKYSPVTAMKWMFLFATIISLPICYGDVAATDWASLTLSAYLRIGYVVIFATFITYFLIPVSQKVLRPTTISMYNYLQPIVGAIIAVALHLDSFGWEKLLSGGLVFLGVYLVTRSKSREQVERDES
ncbi:DMT family transporter [Bacteroidales bacterium OttesenSCG-928-B11]|nr:DMT family transporter [Bacteroidales bacterium OttesenSCG-928-E04]MDL2309363.1 DMT family transporter [Bacteroidales bacterium OttesenSCG-928-C03]MDL2312000.1 DMT family transporter [Bacteroidales bacterium OttesenSCG-928-B11]MDL2326544.1 DMT family transporter [Bacteroidales bacterium OttesenSCG-928-A14]